MTTPSLRHLLCAALLPALLLLPSLSAQGETKVDHHVAREYVMWCNTWWDATDHPKLPRVLLIGDSITCAFSPVVRELLKDKYHVDLLGTSSGINDPVLLKETRMMLEEYPYAAIHFNNGIHNMDVADDAYDKHLREYVALLRKLGGHAKLTWGASTPLTNSGDVNTVSANNAIMISRNALAAKIMAESHVPVVDLYSLVLGKPDLRSSDGYHYEEAGYKLMAKTVAEAILQATK